MNLATFIRASGAAHRRFNGDLRVALGGHAEMLLPNAQFFCAAGVIAGYYDQGHHAQAGEAYGSLRQEVSVYLSKKGFASTGEQFDSRVKILIDAWLTDLSLNGRVSRHLAEVFSALCTTDRPDVRRDDLVPALSTLEHMQEFSQLTDEGAKLIEKARTDPRAIPIPIDGKPLWKIQEHLCACYKAFEAGLDDPSSRLFAA